MMKNQFDKEYSTTSALKDNFSKKSFEGGKPIKLSDFRTKDGVVRSRITKDLREYAINAEEFQKTSIGAYEKLIETCEELVRDFDKISDTLVRACDQIHNLGSIHKKFNEQCKEGKWSIMQKMYHTMGVSFSKWSKE